MRGLVAAAVAAPVAGVVGFVAIDSVTESSATPVAATAAAAKVAFVDVGQGDGVVMRIGDKFIVSDAGELFPERVDGALRELGATSKIDVAIMSHAHDDHAANFIALMRDFGWTIGQAVLSDSAWWRGTKTNRKLMAMLDERSVQRRVVSRGDRFRWGGAKWKILNPPFGEFTGGKNQSANASIAYLLDVNGAQLLFTGDIEERVALALVSELHTTLDERVDIFLATHHGSKHGSPDELLAAARPRFAVLSVGENSFEHPAPEAITRLRDAGMTIWCTDANGTTTARISASGRITWTATDQQKPWWSSRDRRQTGTCVDR